MCVHLLCVCSYMCDRGCVCVCVCVCLCVWVRESVWGSLYTCMCEKVSHCVCVCVYVCGAALPHSGDVSSGYESPLYSDLQSASGLLEEEALGERMRGGKREERERGAREREHRGERH